MDAKTKRFILDIIEGRNDLTLATVRATRPAIRSPRGRYRGVGARLLPRRGELSRRAGDVRLGSFPGPTLLPYDGDVGVSLQHVGLLVGPQAHARLWPEIVRWVPLRAEADEAVRPRCDAAA